MTNDGLASLRLQMQQLTELHAADALGEAQYQAARVAVERRIVDAVLQGAAPAPAKAVTQSATSRPLVAGLGLAVVAIAAVGYCFFGTPQAITAPASAAAAPAGQPGSAHPLTSDEIEGMIVKLATRLKERPDDADGWAMLGRSYAALGKHEQAAPALKQAMALRPDDAVLIADCADALVVINGRKLDGEPAALVARALQVDPNNLKALSLAGTIAFDRKDYAAALQHWEKLAQLAPTSDFAKQIQSGIDDARKLMAGAPVSAAKPAWR
jgi:cytochrome c-type biogenesis protein CcmH